MGYTHYWRRPADLDEVRFRAFSEDAARLLARVRQTMSLAREYDDPATPPEISADLVAFNGVGNEGHETLYIERRLEPRDRDTPDEAGRYFEFCKTARKGYDLAVVAVLLALRYHFPEVAVDSDGGREDWAEGALLYEEALGRRSDFLAVVA